MPTQKLLPTAAVTYWNRNGEISWLRKPFPFAAEFPRYAPILLMKARISVITLGVEDLERALTFYRDGLGLPTDGIVGEDFDHGAVAFFELQAGLRLAIWPRSSIAHDTGLTTRRVSPSDFTIGHNVSSRSEVDDVMEQARAAGAVILKAARDTFWGGYAGYFQDPDGHVWEIVWNPQFLPLD